MGKVPEYKDKLYTWVKRGEIRGAANLKSLVAKLIMSSLGTQGRWSN